MELLHLKFDIYERINIPDTHGPIFEIKCSSLVPHVAMRADEMNLVVKGCLLVTISYKSERNQTLTNQYTVPVEILIPLSRVKDHGNIDVVIDHHSTELLAARNFNLTGVLIVRERRANEMERVKLPREVAEAIEEFRRCEETTADIITSIFNGADSKAAFNLRVFSKDHGRFDDLLKALVNGYEVEQTPEDKVREYYNELQASFPNSHAAQSADTVVIVLDMLNIKIQGVNE